MRSKEFDGMKCPIATVMGAVGDRWGLLIIRDLFLGLSRYDDLQRSTGVTNGTLTDRLRVLGENALIERVPYQSGPPRYDYLLTAKGREIAPVLFAMAQVGQLWNAETEVPSLRLVDRQTGNRVMLAAVDVSSGRLVATQEIAVEAGPGADGRMRWRLEQGMAKRKPGAQSSA